MNINRKQSAIEFAIDWLEMYELELGNEDDAEIAQNKSDALEILRGMKREIVIARMTADVAKKWAVDFPNAKPADIRRIAAQEVRKAWKEVGA